jgi:hypothetical protein
MVKGLAIFREAQNSPNRENDDEQILRAVVDQLNLQRLPTTLMTPERADDADLLGWDMIIPMCESYPRLMRLASLEKRGPALIVNKPSAALATYRARMLELFLQTPGLLFPETELRLSGRADSRAPAFDMSQGAWIKRGDVHNTCDHDVVFARDAADIDDIRLDFQRREIPSYLVQRHVDGDLVKFYGVGPGQWFTWFYHDRPSSRRLPFELEDLAGLAARAAGVLGLEIFGGDAIVSPRGAIYLIDINSWPSFARVRAEAAVQISRHLSKQLRSLEEKPS